MEDSRMTHKRSYGCQAKPTLRHRSSREPQPFPQCWYAKVIDMVFEHQHAMQKLCTSFIAQTWCTSLEPT